VLDDRGEQVVGILYTHDLLRHAAGQQRVGDAAERQIHYLHEDDNLDVALKAMLRVRPKLFVVVNGFAEYMGVIALEDILEEIVDRQVVDEFDEHADLRRVAARHARQGR